MATDYDGRLGPGVAERIEAVFKDALRELGDHLNNVGLPTESHTTNDDLKWATALLGYGVYGNGRAIEVLYDADVGRQIPGHVRSQFEAGVRIEYMEHIDPSAATDFIDSEPFERWDLAREHNTLSPRLRQAILNDARKVVRRRRDLQKIKGVEEMLAGKMPFKPIVDKLKPKKVDQMIDKLNKQSPGWSRDLYTVMFRIGSLGTHQSIVFLRDAFQEVDGVPMFTINQHYIGAPDYLLQSTNYLMAFAHKVAQRFGRWDQSAQERLAAIWARHDAIAKETKAKDGNTTIGGSDSP